MSSVRTCLVVLVMLVAIVFSRTDYALNAQETPSPDAYRYEEKPTGVAFQKLNPRKAPSPGELLIEKGDLVAIAGDSITEQRMYSVLVESYLVACLPEMQLSVRQYGWSGEKTDGFLRRMQNDCLRFKPDVLTLSYGMNDARYRPFDETNGRWYEDHYTAIVRRAKQAGAHVVVGSPGCSGKLATWVKSRSGTLEEHNQHLCALRDIAMGVAEHEGVAFADVFWPMYKANVLGPGQYPGSDGMHKYELAGRDGIHPGWAGHAIMAYAYLRALGLDGDLGTITVDAASESAEGVDGHEVKSFSDGELVVTSSRYPFCAAGPRDRDDSVRSGLTFVPFDNELNRLTLRIENLKGLATVTWGGESKTYSPAQLREGINLAAEFTSNPFCESFAKVQQAVADKQAYETRQIKSIFHGKAGKADIEKAVQETESVRQPLADAVRQSVVPLTHTMKIVW